jgi:hypothetical protein
VRARLVCFEDEGGGGCWSEAERVSKPHQPTMHTSHAPMHKNNPNAASTTRPTTRSTSPRTAWSRTPTGPRTSSAYARRSSKTCAT